MTRICPYCFKVFNVTPKAHCKKFCCYKCRHDNRAKLKKKSK